MNQQTRNFVLGAVAIVALGAAAFLYARGSGGGSMLPREYKMKGVCLACQKEGEYTIAARTAAPYKCKECGKEAVYPFYYCFNCKKRFVPDLVRLQPGGPLRLPPETKCPCPTCQSTDIGQWVADATQAPTGTAPLPKWEP